MVLTVKIPWDTGLGIIPARNCPPPLPTPCFSLARETIINAGDYYYGVLREKVVVNAARYFSLQVMKIDDIVCTRVYNVQE